MEITQLKDLLKQGKAVRICKWCRDFYVPKSNFTQYCPSPKKCSTKARNRREYKARLAKGKGRKIKKPGAVLICKMCRKVITEPRRYRYHNKRCENKARYLKQYEIKIQNKIDKGLPLNKTDNQMQKIIKEIFYTDNNQKNQGGFFNVYQ